MSALGRGKGVEFGQYLPFPLIGCGNRPGFFLAETLACPGQGGSPETASGQTGAQDFVILVEQVDQVIEFGDAVFEEFG